MFQKISNEIFWAVVFMVVLVGCSVSSEVHVPTKVTTLVPTSTARIVYRDATNKFELTYSPSDFEIDSYKYPGIAVDFLLNLEDNFPGKNLEEVRVSIAVNPECHFVKVYNYAERATINGMSFTKIPMRDSGSGTNIFETITYQTTRNEQCYEIHINIREYRLDVFPNLSEYSRALLDTKLNDFVNTFRFIE